MSLLPLADYGDDEEDEEVPQPSSHAVLERVLQETRPPGFSPSTPSRDSKPARPATNLVKLRSNGGSRAGTPSFENAHTPSAPSEPSPRRDADEDADESRIAPADGTGPPNPVTRRNEILAPKNKDRLVLPPEPEGAVDPQLQAKMEKWTQLKREGTSFNKALMNNKAFRNPSIMNKLIEFLDLDQFGSNFPPDSFDPRGFGPESFLEELTKAQNQRSEQRTLPGGAPSGPSGPLSRQIAFQSNGEQSTVGRQSKWDKQG
ncbi:HCNGP-like protein-domain-containing protein [Hyaloraphidium curvatum]|nr:HCNGP-like protein-domain-containing protein [Hyaloraphidium curvatum]